MNVAMRTSSLSGSENSVSPRRHSPSQYRKEQDPAIIEVFARAEQPVLTTTEIADELENIGLKQTRRRLFDLVDEDIVGTRKPARDRIWWLIEEVEEPITVRYPLLRHVRNRFEVQITLLGSILGLVGAFSIMLYLGLEANSVAPPLISRGYILVFGLYSIAIGIAGIAGGIAAILILFLGTRIYARMAD